MSGQWEQKRNVLACLQKATEYAGKDLSFVLTEDEKEVEVTDLRSYEHITIRVAYDSPGALIMDVLKGIERWLM
jgi:hypothetical protein